VEATRESRKWSLVARLALLALLATGISACGDDGGEGGVAADRAFLEAMIPHHESAISMARVAQRRAEHPQITELADAIVTTQAKEIRQIERIHQRIFGERILPNEDAHATLDLSAEEAGMGHMETAQELKGARPFDKAFIDAMISHHQGAIRMAEAVRQDTDNGEIRTLANAIVTTQSNEIEAMNRWRRAWYGEASPSGGVPARERGEQDSNGGHEGH
jgi:uncharacterized protein (DUF305 family)